MEASSRSVLRFWSDMFFLETTNNHRANVCLTSQNISSETHTNNWNDFMTCHANFSEKFVGTDLSIRPKDASSVS